MVDSGMKRHVALVVVLAAAGCGSNKGSMVTSKATPLVGNIPECARLHGSAGIAPFPLSFPLPRGTKITSNKQQSGGTILTGAIPTDSLAATAQFFLTQVPKRGFKIRDSETEAPRDAEGEFQGKGYVGRWRLQAITGCRGAVRFQAFAQPLKSK